MKARHPLAALVVAAALSGGCATEQAPADEGLRAAGPMTGDSTIERIGRFVLLDGGETRVVAREHGVAGDATIVAATVENPNVASFEPVSAAEPTLAAKLTAHAIGQTTLHVTTASGQAFVAPLVVDEPGTSGVSAMLHDSSACDLEDLWYDLSPVVGTEGVVLDARGADVLASGAPLYVGANAVTRGGERRTGWGGLDFVSSAPATLAVPGATSLDDVFWYGIAETQFVDARPLRAGADGARGPAEVAVGDAKLSVDVEDAPAIADVAFFVASASDPPLARVDPSTRDGALQMSNVFLGKPRECADLIVLPLDAGGRPIVGTRTRAAITSGDGVVALAPSSHPNHVGLLGRQLGSATVTVTVADRSIAIPIQVVASSR